MSLIVSIIKAPDSVVVSESSKSFDAKAGTIGRGPDNIWILDDPERYLSTRHCQISCDNGHYFITDQSTNGTFYNGSPNPIGKGSKVALNDGDTFIIGDYEFSVKLSDSPADSIPADPFSDSMLINSYTSPFSSSDDFADAIGDVKDPFASGHVSATDSLFGGSQAETDPLAALDKAQGKLDEGAGFDNNENLFGSVKSTEPFSNQNLSMGTFSDQADPLNQQISWPEAVVDPAAGAASGGIPDDWDDELSSPSALPDNDSYHQSMPLTSPPVMPAPARPVVKQNVQSTPPVTTNSEQPVLAGDNAKNGFSNNSAAQHDLLLKENAKLQAELDSLKQQVNAQRRGEQAEVTVDTSLINSLGLQNYNLTDSEIIKINQLAGDIIKQMVSGLMQVLGSRGSVKNEFRMHVTTIQPVENNPLKFSATVEDALENMFVKKGKSYKKPVEAVQEGFESVAEHQVAILAGIKSAFKGVIQRFDPVLLEERFSKQNKGGFIPGIQKAKNWDLYNQYFNDLAGDIDNSFQFLFGDDFVRAYEEQLQKMTIAKKAKKNQ